MVEPSFDATKSSNVCVHNVIWQWYRVSQNYPNILFWRPVGRAKQFYISSLFSSMVNLISNIVVHSVRQILFQNHHEI